MSITLGLHMCDRGDRPVPDALVAAGELGLRTVILESRPKAGRKLLMCGNNRCNLSQDRRDAQTPIDRPDS